MSSPVVTSASLIGLWSIITPLTRTSAVTSSPSPSAEALALIPVIVTVCYHVGLSGKSIPPSRLIVGGDSPRDRGATVREYFLTHPPYNLRYYPSSTVAMRHRNHHVVGEAHDHITLVVRSTLVIWVFSVMLITALSPMGGRPKLVWALHCNWMPPTASVMPSARTVVGIAWEGETLLRLRHAAARHGEQYEHDEAAFQYCFVILRHLLLLGIHSSSGSELHSCDRSESVAATRVTGVYS